MEAQSVPDLEVVQEGSRWRHGPPSPGELGAWFKEQPLHPGMAGDHERYMGGLVLISSKEKVSRTRVANNGAAYVHEDEEVVYTPYVRVDTRIAYFRDYVANHRDWIAEIKPVPAHVIADPTSPYFNAHIADRGFAVHPISVNNRTTFYVVCTMEVAVYEQESWASRVKGQEVKPILQGIGTKQVAMTRSYGNNANSAYADDNCLMKAETGAVGRALGFLGMLVVGTGVATAEDVQEATTEQGASVSTPDAKLPPVVNREGEPVQAAAAPVQAIEAAVPEVEDPGAADEALRAQALTLQKEMQEQFPATWEAFMEWWRDRSFGGLATLTGPALRGAVMKLERDLDAAKNAPPEPPLAHETAGEETSG